MVWQHFCESNSLLGLVDDGTGTLDFSDFVLVMGEKSREADNETHFKDTFRVFSKDEDGKGGQQLV